VKKYIRGSLAIAALVFLSGWGDTGHTMISYRVNMSFNEEMGFFDNWVFYLSEHASDPDIRKKDDPEEGPKHYIDIDNYDSFKSGGSIPSTLDSCIMLYGDDFVGQNGYLPWATKTSYDSLVACLTRGDYASAKQFAADMGHYVADGHMPFHLTRNYDGQFTGNKGIHARYEIEMIARYKNDITYTGTPAGKVDDVQNYIFEYIYGNYPYVDSLIMADDYAYEIGNGNTSEQYYMALWEKTADMTTLFFQKASNAFAELLYAAWIEAGKPVSDGTSSADQLKMQKKYNAAITIFPNPASAITTIRAMVPRDVNTTASVYNGAGIKSISLKPNRLATDTREYIMDTSSMENGIYYFVLRSDHELQSSPIIVCN